VGYSAERDLADAALAQDRVDRSSRFPPASKHLRAAREANGLTPRQLADRFGAEGHLCPDLELYDDELFTCIAVDDLLHLARALETSAPALLFGAAPPGATPAITFSEVAERIRSSLSATGSTAEAWGDMAGWDVKPILQDPAALGSLNVQGLHDVCKALGVDWVGVLGEHNRRDRPTTR
jgi:hypothetical protein